MKSALQAYDESFSRFNQPRGVIIASTAQEVRLSTSVLLLRGEQHKMSRELDLAVVDLREQLAELSLSVKKNGHLDEVGTERLRLISLNIESFFKDACIYCQKSGHEFKDCQKRERDSHVYEFSRERRNL